MEDRFNNIYSLPSNIYKPSSPVIILAGSLLKDNADGNIIGQLKIRNISDKVIKAVSVNISTKDVAGRDIGDLVEHHYLDLNVARSGDFGTQEPIIFSDNRVRAIELYVSEVVYIDGSIWNDAGDGWKSLGEFALGETVFDNKELFEQFKIDNGADCKYKPSVYNSIWLCTCGEINIIGEEHCHRCGRTLAVFDAIDNNKLNQEIEKRNDEERRQKEQDSKESQKRKKMICLASIIVVAIIATIIILKPSSETIKVKEHLVSSLDSERFEEIAGALDDYYSLSSFEQFKAGKSNANKAHDFLISSIEEYIAAIGEVNAKSEASIIKACNAYKSLPESLKQEVSNYNVLKDSVDKYNSTKIVINADNLKDYFMIDAIIINYGSRSFDMAFDFNNPSKYIIKKLDVEYRIKSGIRTYYVHTGYRKSMPENIEFFTDEMTVDVGIEAGAKPELNDATGEIYPNLQL